MSPLFSYVFIYLVVQYMCITLVERSLWKKNAKYKDLFGNAQLHLFNMCMDFGLIYNINVENNILLSNIALLINLIIVFFI